jgi:hypothetical protein
MRRLGLFIVLSVIGVFALALVAPGCGSKKPKTKTATDADAGTDTAEEQVDSDTGAEAPPPEQDTGSEQPATPEPPKKGPAVFPPAPANDFPNRQPQEYLLSIKKAQLLPAKDDGQCWDDCQGEAATAIGTAASKIGALPPASQSAFELPAKALQMGLGAVGGSDALPDVFVHIRCGHGQGHMTNKKGAKDKIIAAWTYENKAFSLDERDECAISVWDSDDDGDEPIGQVVVPLVQRAKAGGGKAIIYGAEDGFGQVYSLEIGLTPKNEVPANPNDKGTITIGGKTVEIPKATYTVEVIKGQVSKTKKDGKAWDDAPLAGKLGGLGGMAGGVDADLYVEAWINGYQSQAPFFTTAVKKDVYYAEWKEGSGVTLKDTDFIDFMVWDKDLSQNDLIGECKTKPIAMEAKGEITMKNCGGVEYLVVKITKN